MSLPHELLAKIGFHLDDRNDLCNFRLISQTAAGACKALIPRNGISVIISYDCLNELLQLLEQRDIAVNVKKITLFYGKWMYYASQPEWQSDSIVLDWIKHSTPSALEIGQAFIEYTNSIAKESQKTVGWEIEILTKILTSLSRLYTICVDSVNCILRHRTHIVNPQSYFQRQNCVNLNPDLGTTSLVFSLLCVFDKLPISTCGIKFLDLREPITTIKLYGNTSPQPFKAPEVCLKIETLYISALETDMEPGLAPEHEFTALWFMEIFPNLVTLRIGDLGCSCQPRDILSYRLLKVLQFSYIAMDYLDSGDLFHILQRQPVLKEAYISFEGTGWNKIKHRKLLSRIQPFNPELRLEWVRGDNRITDHPDW
jgi:hypothetical protein